MTALHGQKYTKSGLAQNLLVLILSQSEEASRYAWVWLRQTNRDLPWHCIRRSPAAARRYIDDEEYNFSTDVNRHTLLFMVWRSPTPTLSASHIFTACASRCAYTTIIFCCRWMIYLILTTAMKSSICNTNG